MKQYFLAERLKYRHTSMNAITVMMRTGKNRRSDFLYQSGRNVVGDCM
ncbi:MAG: hypothetical protein ACI4S0_06405 [Dorea sp.]